MLKYTQALLLLGMLVAHSTILCFADFQNPQTDLKSDAEEFPDLLETLIRREDQLERSLTSKNGCRYMCKAKQVAFFVGMTSDFGPVSQVTDVVFDTIITNIGSGYSTSTGHFQAPVAGTYQFNVNLGAQYNEKAVVWMIKNGLKVMEIYAVYSPHWGPGTRVAVLSLNEGDTVWLQVGDIPKASHILGRMYTIFSGSIIFED